MVSLQSSQSLLQVSRSLLDVLSLFSGQLVQVLIDRCRRLNAVTDTVQTSHQLSSKREVGVSGGVRCTELQTLSLRVGAGNRDADTGGTVTLRVHHVDGSLVAGNQTLVRVHGRVGERQNSGGVLNQTANVPACGVREVSVAALVVEEGLAVLPQRLVAVHTGAVVTEHGLGHEGHGLAPCVCGALDDVLELQQVVSSLGEGVELVVDFCLAGCAHLVVATLNLKADLVHCYAHCVTQVSLLVDGGDGEVAALDGGLVAQVAALFLAAGVPGSLIGVDLEEYGVRLDLVADVLEDEEFSLGCEERGVCNAGGLQVRLGTLSDAAGVTVVGLAGAGVHDGADDDQGLLNAEGVNVRGLNVGNQLHVGLCNALEAANGGAVKKLAVDEEIVINRLSGQVEVLLHAGHVGESDINEDYFFVLDKVENFLGAGKHEDCSLFD